METLGIMDLRELSIVQRVCKGRVLGETCGGRGGLRVVQGLVVVLGSSSSILGATWTEGFKRMVDMVT